MGRIVLIAGTCAFAAAVAVAFLSTTTDSDQHGGSLRRHLRGLQYAVGCNASVNSFGQMSTACNSSSKPAERSPTEAALAMKRASLRLRMNSRKFQRKVAGRDYAFEYYIQEYTQQGGNSGRAQQSDYIRVKVADGVVSPAGHNSAMKLFTEIKQYLRDARREPTKLGKYRLKYSRRFGLPRYVRIEHDGKVLEISARKLNIIGDKARPTT